MRKNQILIAFGKYVAGYRPGDWGWTKHDEAALSLVMNRSNSEPQTELGKIDNSDLLPCPHCGSTDIRTDPIMFSDDEGEHAGVECMNCDAIARHERWNQRPSKHHKVPDWVINLQHIAERATKGPWHGGHGACMDAVAVDYRNEHGNMTRDSFTKSGRAKLVCKANPTAWRPIGQVVNDMKFISAANPEAVLSLISLLASAQQGGDA